MPPETPPPSSAGQPLPARPTRPRAEQRFIAAYCIIVGVPLAAVAYGYFPGGVTIRFQVQYITSFVALGLAIFLPFHYFRQRIILKFLRPRNGFVCPRCHYGLVRLPDAGNCPEC